MRLITAPCVGAVVGALAEGANIAIVAVVYDSPDTYPLLDAEWVFFLATWGIIFGGILGGIIGLVVALRAARGRDGLLLGTAIGFACAVWLLRRAGFGDPAEDGATAIAVLTILACASAGFLSAVATAPSNESQPPAEPRRSGRIFE